MEGRRQLGPPGAALLSIVFLISLASVTYAAADPFEDGVALARLGRWDEARAALLAGHRLRPNDERFLIELGGVAFKQKRYAEAAGWLRRALRLNPGDTYAADFLATIYFLQGNLEAALKYWNRIEKPRIESVRVEPKPRVDPVLLDRAFAFAPASTLRLPEYVMSRARIGALGIFPAYNIHLDAREDGAFDATFTSHERNGWGSRRECAAFDAAWRHLSDDLPRILQPGAIRDQYRRPWFDGTADKRRVRSAVSGPLRGDPAYRYSLGVDLRDENWDMREVSALKLRKSAVHAAISSYRSAGLVPVNGRGTLPSQLPEHRAGTGVAGGCSAVGIPAQTCVGGEARPVAGPGAPHGKRAPPLLRGGKDLVRPFSCIRAAASLLDFPLASAHDR